MGNSILSLLMPESTHLSSKHSEDLALVRAVLSGQSEARAVFAERMKCVPRYLATANARKGSPLKPDDISDLAQDTVIEVWKKLETFEARAALESWVWRFCQLQFSACIRAHYRRSAYHSVPAQEAEALQVAPEESAPIDNDYIEQSLRALGPPSEEVVRMKHFEHLKFQEIAERLDLSQNTVKTRYYRGMVWLKSFLERGSNEL